MIVVRPCPLQVAHAKPVREHGELPRRVGKRLGERMAVKRERPSVAAKLHRQRERIAGVGEMVSDDAVEGRERDLAPTRRRPVVRLCADERRRAADTLARQLDRAADAAIDKPRRAAGHARTERGDSRRLEDGRVQMLDKGGQSICRIYGETADSESVREGEGGGLGGHWRLLRSTVWEKSAAASSRQRHRSLILSN